LGETWGVAVDAHDHPWLLHSTNQHDRDIFDLAAKEGKKLAPPVIELDAQGNVVQAWGGPGRGYSWPEGRDWAEHGLWIDRNNGVWIAGNRHVVLKFTRKGKFLARGVHRSRGAGRPPREPKSTMPPASVYKKGWPSLPLTTWPDSLTATAALEPPPSVPRSCMPPVRVHTNACDARSPRRKL